jgi:hypothetical protein
MTTSSCISYLPLLSLFLLYTTAEEEMSERDLLIFLIKSQITGAEWPAMKQPTSPCPTLKLISFVTSIVEGKEALERGVNKKPATMKEAMERFARA